MTFKFKMHNILKSIIKGKVVFLGMGNVLRGDDGTGPFFIDQIKGKVRAVCINGETTPENYLGKVIKENPDTIILVDAIQMNLKPGNYRILNKEEIENSGFSTHTISPFLLIDFLEKQTEASIYLLGFQPKNTELGECISMEVKETIEKLSAFFKRTLR